MSEENLMQSNEPELDNGITEPEINSEYSDIEQSAMDHGWKPDFDKNHPSYRGPQAYLDFHKERTKFSDEIGDLKSGIKNLTDGFDSLTKRQQNEHKKELEKALDSAEKDLDFDAYKDVSAQLTELENVEPKQSKSSEANEPSFVKTFRSSNPVLDATSSDFNSDFNLIVESGVNNRIKTMASQGHNITEDLSMKVLKEEFERARGTMPHLFENKSKRSPKVNDVSKSSALNVDSLPKDVKDMYTFIKDNQSKEAAESFLKNCGAQ